MVNCAHCAQARHQAVHTCVRAELFPSSGALPPANCSSPPARRLQPHTCSFCSCDACGARTQLLRQQRPAAPTCGAFGQYPHNAPCCLNPPIGAFASGAAGPRPQRGPLLTLQTPADAPSEAGTHLHPTVAFSAGRRPNAGAPSPARSRTAAAAAATPSLSAARRAPTSLLAAQPDGRGLRHSQIEPHPRGTTRVEPYAALACPSNHWGRTAQGDPCLRTLPM